MKEIKINDTITIVDVELDDVVLNVENNSIDTKNNGTIHINSVYKVNGKVWLSNLLNKSRNDHVEWLSNYWLNSEERDDEQDVLVENILQLVSEIDNLKLKTINRECESVYKSLKNLEEEKAGVNLKYIAFESMSSFVRVSKSKSSELTKRSLEFNIIKRDIINSGINEIPELIVRLQNLYDSNHKP
jgi:hypothetical protein